MKIKEIDRTANTAWSPKGCHPIYLAAGTAAQQLDSSFSTKSALEIYEFDVNSPGLDLPVKATLPCENRFHKLIWGGHGMGSGDKDKHASGLIVGGCDGGAMHVYDANKLLNGKEDPLVLTKTKHTGPVRALEFNDARLNLLASGGGADSDILIWDLNNPKTAMSPGKSQPPDEVTCLAWNKQVEHILASTFSSRCVVWDLRKNEPIIKLADTATRIKYRVVAWHPTVATQMCLGSEDDTNPVIQLWDLRYATAPLKVLQGHERGVLGLAWCQNDPELLLSCGKDNRINCWNPNYPIPGYELVCDIPTSSQWSFDVAFCPRNPLVISTASFDGRISLFTLSGGAQQPVTKSNLADSFPGMNIDIAHTPVPSQKPVPVQLRDAPKWLKRPCGSSFAFGGKLITFANVKQTEAHAGDLPDRRVVTISQIVTLPDLIARSRKLEGALSTGAMADFCEEKATEALNEGDSEVWQFLQASFMPNPNEIFLHRLGFDPSVIHEKLASKIVNDPIERISEGFVSLGYSTGNTNNHSVFDNGNFLDTSQASTRSVTPEPEKMFPIQTDETTEGLLNQALLSGNIEYAVELCLKDSRWADALILASTGGPELIKKAQIRYFHKCETQASNMIRAVVTGDLRRLVERCELECWKQALATAITYADPSEFSYLAEILGRRLETSKNEKIRKNALLCYICCGNMNRLVDGWASDDSKGSTPENLQGLVEQVMVLKKAAEIRGGREKVAMSTALASKLVQYATLLISQGCLDAALHYVDMEDASDPSLLALRERLHYSLGLVRPTRSAFQPRSRQTSESSSRPGQTGLLYQKRPSYPSAPSPAIPGLDNRRMSGFHSGEPNISSLTGPPQQPHFESQPYDVSKSNPYNPINVNVNSNWNSASISKPSPYAPTQPMQPDPVSSGHYSAGSSVKSSFYNPADTVKDFNRKDENNTTGLLRMQPPVSSVSSGWNDPPLLTNIARPKKSTTPAAAPMEPITHPIFGSGPVPNTFNPPPTPTSTQYNPNYSASLPPPPPFSTSNMQYNSNYSSSALPPPPPLAPASGIQYSQTTPNYSSASLPPPPPMASGVQYNQGPSNYSTPSFPPPPRQSTTPAPPVTLNPISQPVFSSGHANMYNSFPPPPASSGMQYNQVTPNYSSASLPPPPPMGGFYGQAG